MMAALAINHRMLIVVNKGNKDDRGRNIHFMDNFTGTAFMREIFIIMIERGLYPKYQIRTINGVKILGSNPNSRLSDNLE